MKTHQMFEVLTGSGYAIDMEDVRILRTGLGIDADGKVDLAEVIRMCEDIASNQVQRILPRDS